MLPITSAAGFSEEPPLLQPQASGQGGANVLSATKDVDPDRLLQEGQALYYRGSFAEALEALQVALAQYRALGDTPDRYRGEVESLTAIAEVYLWLNRHDESLDLAQQALEIARTHQNDRGEVWALNIAGVAQLNLGRLEESETSYQQALELGSTLADEFPLNLSRVNLGTFYMAQGNIAAAREQFQQALVYLEQPPSSPALELRQQYYQALTLQWEGLGAFRAEDFDQALSLFEQSLTLSRDIGNPAVEAETLLVKGQLHQQRSEEALALAAYQQALLLYQGLDQPLEMGSVSFIIGRFYTAQDQAAQAVAAYQQAASAFEQAEAYDQQAQSLHWLGHAHRNLEQYPQALAAYQQALELHRSGENRWYEAHVLLNMGHAYYFQKETAEAEAAFRQGLTVAQQIPDRLQETLALLGLGHALIQRGNALQDTEAYEESRLVYQQSIERFQAARTIALELEETRQEQNAIEGIVGGYLDIAWTYDYQNNYAEQVVASQYTLDVLEAYRERLPETAFLERKMIALTNLGIAYSNAGQYAESIQAHQASAAIAEQLENFEFQVQQLLQVAQRYNRLNQYEQARAIGQQALTIARDKLPQNRDLELSLLLSTGKIYNDTRQYDVALEYYQQAGLLAQELNNPSIGNTVFNNIGLIYIARGQYLQALEPLQQVWEIDQLAIQQLQTEGLEAVERLCGESAASLGVRGQQNCLRIFQHRNSTTLNNLALVYHGLGRYSEVIETYQTVLEFSRGIRDRHSEMIILSNLGTVYASIGEYTKAIDVYQQSLQTARDIDSRSQEALALNNLGHIYEQQGRYPEALELYQAGLSIAQDIGDPSTEATLLAHIGGVYRAQGKLAEALALSQTSLNIRQQLGEAVNTNLNNIALLYKEQGQLETALEYLYQALDITRTLGDRTAEASALGNIAALYAAQADYAKALEVQQQAASLRQELGGGPNQFSALAGLGQIYVLLGQYDQALTYFQQALQISRDMGKKAAEMAALSWLSRIYQYQNQYDLALEHLQQALQLAQGMGNVADEGRGLVSISRLYQQQGRFDEAVERLEQALKTQRQIGVRFDEGNTLTHLGLAYGSRGDVSKAVEILQQAMAIHQETGDLAKEAETLANLGQVLQATQPELAIVFYKQAVNLREGIRGNLQGLSQDLQQSYTDSVADTYRDLADMLLQQNRVLEAQRVLDLLKVQELDEYLNNVQRSSQTQGGVDFWQVETDLLALYQQVLNQATELAQLETQSPATRTAAEQQRLDELQAMRRQAESWFFGFLDDPLVIETVDQIRASTRGRNLEPENFRDLTNNLRLMPQATAALYPLILEDRLELVLVMPEGPPLRYPVAVSSETLNAAIVAFGQALKSPESDIEPLAQQLYSWIIGPMHQQLEQAGIESIIYAPDGALRYIPLAALHDGEQYLAQRFSISHITTASLTDLNIEPQRQNRRTLAAACAECSFTVEVGGQEFLFADLPFTITEVQTLAEQDSAVDVLLNQDFNADAMANLASYNIVHLATHAAFVTGTPDESFILFGDGETINLRAIGRDWKLDNAELVVLSACETAVGSTELGSGVEILGLGYQIEQAGAQATLASLWKVSDGGTQQLMTAFYGALQQGMTKTEALRQAQLALINNDFSAVGGRRADLDMVSAAIHHPPTPTTLAHPYYWAPFILIGNGL